MITTKSDKDEAFRIITEGFLPMRKLCATSFDLMKSIGIALSALCKRSHIDTLQLCRGDVQSVIAHLAGEELPSDVIPWTATPPSPYDIIFDIHYIFRKGTGDKDQLSMLLKFTQRLIAARTLEEYLTKFEDNPHESWDTTLVVALRYLSTSSTKQTSDEYISMLISAMADACPNIRRIATSLLLKLLGSTKPPSIRNGANQLVATVIQRLQFEQVHAIRSTLADLLKVTYEHDGIDLATRQATIITAYDCVADIATHDAALALLRRTHPLDVGTVDDQLMVRNSSYMQFACDLMKSGRMSYGWLSNYIFVINTHRSLRPHYHSSPLSLRQRDFLDDW